LHYYWLPVLSVSDGGNTDVKEILKWKLWAILNDLKWGLNRWRGVCASIGFYGLWYVLIHDQEVSAGPRDVISCSWPKPDWTFHVLYESLHMWLE
jgi:hypothetical protein